MVFIDLKRREETRTKKESERLKNLSEESLRKLLLPFCSAKARRVERDREKRGRMKKRRGKNKVGGISVFISCFRVLKN